MIRKIYILILIPLSIFASAHAFAALGGDASSVQVDVDVINSTPEPAVSADQLKKSNKKLKSTQAAITQKENYDLHEITTTDGYVREYVSKTGQVFAVAWRGAQPDLSQIFGKHFSDFAQARGIKEKEDHGKRFRQVQTSDLDVSYGGHMKNLKGRAILVKNLPLGVTADEIQ